MGPGTRQEGTRRRNLAHFQCRLGMTSRSRGPAPLSAEVQAMASHPGVHSDSLGPPGCSHLGFVGLKFFQRGSLFISDLSHCWDKMPGKGNLKEEGSILAFRSRMHRMEGKRSRQECRAAGHVTSTIWKFQLLSPLCSVRTPGYIMARPTFRAGLPTALNQIQRIPETYFHGESISYPVDKFNHHGPQQEPRGPMQSGLPEFICYCEPCPVPRVPSSSPALLSPLLD